MIAAIAALLISDLPLGPIKQPGSNALFHQVCAAVEEPLARADFAAAERALAALPKKVAILEWDDSALPATMKADFAAARDAALATIRSEGNVFEIKVGKPGDLKISFVPELPLPAGAAMRPGAVHFFSPSPSEPRVEAVIAMKRGMPYGPADWNDVYNEVGYAIMAYYGKEPSHVPSEFSARTDQHSREIHRMSPHEKLFAKMTLRTVDALTEMVRLKKQIQPARPKIALDVKEVDGGSVVQGTIHEFSLQLTNLGNAPLTTLNRYDCGCLWIQPTTQIDPGETAIVKGTIDTTEFVGDIRKRFIIVTNDPERPSFSIPAKIYAKPLFRMLMPAGDVVLGSEKTGASADLYLALDPAAKLKPGTPTTAGIPASATIEPWSGALADPALQEGPKPRQGYRIRVKVAKGMPPGRHGVTLAIPTDSDQFPVLRHTFYVQTGIVALPTQAFFGEIKREPRRAVSFVSRPGKPFKIVKLVSDVPFATAAASPTQVPNEYKVTVTLDGKQPIGKLYGSIAIHTDDPVQKIVYLLLGGTVR